VRLGTTVATTPCWRDRAPRPLLPDSRAGFADALWIGRIAPRRSVFPGIELTVPPLYRQVLEWRGGWRTDGTKETRPHFCGSMPSWRRAISSGPWTESESGKLRLALPAQLVRIQTRQERQLGDWLQRLSTSHQVMLSQPGGPAPPPATPRPDLPSTEAAVRPGAGRLSGAAANASWGLKLAKACG